MFHNFLESTQWTIDIGHEFRNIRSASSPRIFPIFPKWILVSTGQRITHDNRSTPEDRVPTAVSVIEQILNMRTRLQELVTMKLEVRSLQYKLHNPVFFVKCSRAIGKRVHSGPRSSRHGGWHSQIVR